MRVLVADRHAVSRPVVSDERRGPVRAIQPSERRLLPTLGWVAATALVVVTMAVGQRWTGLPPVIEADNAYIFLAADRMYAGLGATSIPPRAPLQPWEWQGDWTFLTQWPVGYPAMLCSIRLLLGGTTAEASAALAAIACGVALIAWFAWMRRCLPRRMPAYLIAAVAAGAMFSVENLLNPSSDGVLLALTPLVLLGAARALRHVETTGAGASWWRMALLGLLAGSACWVRYAAIFLPAALGVYLILDALLLRRSPWRSVWIYGLSASVPILALLALNRLLGSGSAQAQLNLGDGVSFALSWQVFVDAWMRFTQQTLYAHRPESIGFFALVLPLAMLGVPWLHPGARQRLRGFLASPPVLLSIVVTVTLLAELIAASVLFHEKYNYVAQSRYYQPIRPFYYLLFVGPLALMPWRWLRAVVCVPLVLAGAWFVRQDAGRTIARWRAKAPVATAYGRWPRHFVPSATELFAWLAAQGGDDLVVFSNFHEEIALETGIPACPTPKDEVQLSGWLARITEARGVAPRRVLFVLDPDNDYRDYYLAKPEEILRRFDLARSADAPEPAAPYVFERAPADRPAYASAPP